MKKRLIIFLISILSIISLANAIDLQVSSNAISNGFIAEFNNPCIFDITIKNNGNSGDFRIYSAVGVDITPSSSFFIEKAGSKTIRINALPQGSLKQDKGPLVFEYVIQNSLGEIKTDKLLINVMSIADIYSVGINDLSYDSEKAKISLRNSLREDINESFLKLDSPFFKYESKIALKSGEYREIDIPLDNNKIKSLAAGQYIANIQITYQNKSGQKEIIFKFLEQENIQELDNEEGFLIKRTEIIRRNNGNVRKVISVSVKKNLFTSLFTSINIDPTKKQINGLNKMYLWEKELLPGQELKIVMKTNWLYPFIALILIIVLIILVKKYLETDLIVKKSVYYMNTRGGEFALRVHLRVKAKKFVERIKIIDKIPNLVTLYDKFGAIVPDRIDLVNKRLEWNIEYLNPGEERIFSYVIYSKIGVVGKFELPPAKAVYEKDGEIKDCISNKAFYVNKPKHSTI